MPTNQPATPPSTPPATAPVAAPVAASVPVSSASLPAAGGVVSNGGYCSPAPAPVYYYAAPVYYQPAPVYYTPYPAVVAAPTIWIGGSWGGHRRHW